MTFKLIGRPLFLGMGWLSAALGVIGIIMPLLPATPFLLVAIWAFSKSSPVLAEKIRSHPNAGPFIRDWQDAGVIPLTAKLFAVTMMAAMLAYLHFLSSAPAWLVLFAAVTLAAVSLYIMSRPGQRPD